MVRNYKKKGVAKIWSRESMQAAVDAVINNVMGYHKAAGVFTVPQTTLERHVKKQKANPALRLTKLSKRTDVYRPNCVFSKAQEDLLVNYLVSMKQRLFGLTSTEVRSLAFQLASRSGQEHPFNKEEELAGVDWFFGFHRRHPELSLRKPEATLSCSTSATSALPLSKVAVDKFYDLLEELQSQGFTWDRIYNADEIAITVSPHTRSRVKKARRQVVQDRGCIVTAEICFSAAGTYMPPMLVFPSDQLHEEFEQGLPVGSWVQVHPSGFFSKEFFMQWFQKFVIFSKASKESPVVLLVDGQSPHIKNLGVLDYAKEHGVIFVCFPAQSLPRLQPIDVSFVKPLSHFYEGEVQLWLKTHPGQMITSFQVSPLFGSAYHHSSAAPAAINGFVKTGVWPVVRLAVFRKEDFSSEPMEYDSETTPDECALESNPFTPVVQFREEKPEKTYLRDRSREPAGSNAVLPFRGAAAFTPILKSHSYRPRLRALKKTNDGCKIVKKGCEEEKVGAPSPKSDSSPPASAPAPPLSGDSQDDDDPRCLYCHDFYSKAMEGWWIRCERCLRWAHHFCAGFDDENDQASCHICTMCV